MVDILDKQVVDRWCDKFPQLEIALLSGVVGTKMIRELIDVDRWYMNDMYAELVMAGAVKGVNSSYFKATDECKVYLQERIMRKRIHRGKVPV